MAGKMKYLIFIFICLCFSLQSKEKEPVYEPKSNATIWQDGDGIMLIYYHGHYFVCQPQHCNLCPCQTQK